MWSRPLMSSACPSGSSAASSCGEPAMSSRVPAATKVGAARRVGMRVGQIVEFCGLAVAAIIERDHAAVVAHERRDPAGLHPVDLLVGGKAMHQDDRLARALVEIGDLDVTMCESRHQERSAVEDPAV